MNATRCDENIFIASISREDERSFRFQRNDCVETKFPVISVHHCKHLDLDQLLGLTKL